MKKPKAREVIERCLKEISSEHYSSIISSQESLLEEFLVKVSKRFVSSKILDAYLTYVINYIAELNSFFKKERKSLISYSRLLSFACKDDRINEFLFNSDAMKKTENRSDAEFPGLAGHKFTEKDLKASGGYASFVHGGEVYEKIYAEGKIILFFSPITRKILVTIKGSDDLIFYHSYSKESRKRGLEYVKIGKVFKSLKRQKEKSVTISAFLIHIRQQLAKSRRKNVA